MFDQTQQKTLVGVVKQVQWTNPHIWVQVLVPDKGGPPTEWSIEGGSPNGLSRQGWRRSSIKEGDRNHHPPAQGRQQRRQPDEGHGERP